MAPMNDTPDNDNPKDGEAPTPILPKRSLAARLRNYFLTGIIVTAPISITLYVSWQFIAFIDRQVTPVQNLARLQAVAEFFQTHEALSGR